MNWALVNIHGICENIIVAESFEIANNATPSFLTPVLISEENLISVRTGFKYNQSNNSWIDPSQEGEE